MSLIMVTLGALHIALILPHSVGSIRLDDLYVRFNVLCLASIGLGRKEEH